MRAKLAFALLVLSLLAVSPAYFQVVPTKKSVVREKTLSYSASYENQSIWITSWLNLTSSFLLTYNDPVPEGSTAQINVTAMDSRVAGG